MKKVKRINVDGDILVYRCAAACEHRELKYVLKGSRKEEDTFRFSGKREANKWLKTLDNPEDYVEHIVHTIDPVSYCYHSLNNQIANLQKNCKVKADQIHIYLGGKDNFRKEIYPEYKAGRSEKPEYYEAAREYLLQHYLTEVIDGMEVDDKLAMLQDGNSVIASIDKDLDQVPGEHYHIVDGTSYYVDEEEARFWFWVQMLVGDSTDNIKGINGLGMVKASKVINECDGDPQKMREVVEEQYIKRDGNLDGFNLNLLMIYMRRDPAHVTPEDVLEEMVGE